MMILLEIQPQMLLSMPGGSEWLIILLVVVVLFGGKKIPELARGIGKGIRSFNEAKDGKEEEHTAKEDKQPELKQVP